MRSMMVHLGLHRTHNKADWDVVPHAQRNIWQRLAARTHGMVTPANILTLVGFITTAAGLAAIAMEHYWFAAGSIAFGRLLDVADGLVAERTGTKSPLGESLDASFDKLATFLAVPALALGHVAPWWVLLAVALPNVAIAVIGGVWFLHGHRLHPSRRGKLSMALAWFGMGGLLIVQALNMSHGLLFDISYAILAASVVLGIGAMIGYRHIKQPWKTPKNS